MHYDENYYLNIAQNYIARGELTPYMWRLGDTSIIAGSGSGYGVLILAIWLKLVKGSLYFGRLFMATFGLVAAGLMYQIGKRWWDSRNAGIVSLAFALVSTSPFYTLTIRMDAIGILAYCLVLLIYLSSLKPGASLWLSFSVGILAVITLEFHVLGILYLLAFGFSYLVYFITDIYRTKALLLNKPVVFFALGVGLASFIYYLIHIYPDPKAYFIISQTCYECDEPILTTEIKRLLRLMVFRPLELILLFIVLAKATWRHSPQDKHYVIFTMGWIIAHTIVGLPPYDHYASHFWPLLAIGVGGLVVPSQKAQMGLANRQEDRNLNIALLFSFVILVSNPALFLLGKPPSLLAYQIKETASINYIKNNISTDCVVMSRVPTFYLLRDYKNFLTYHDGDGYGMMLRNETINAFWEREQPEVVLVEENDVLKDPDLQNYLQSRNFVQIYSDLWVADHLR